MPDWYHIYPVNDSREHKLDGFECDCFPDIDWNNCTIIHNSYDHREIVEQAYNLINK